MGRMRLLPLAAAPLGPGPGGCPVLPGRAALVGLWSSVAPAGLHRASFNPLSERRNLAETARL